MTHPIHDVLIAGAGPTGSALAIDLVRRGLSVRVIDKAEGAFDGSRAKGLQPRSLEVFEDLGVLDPILAEGRLYPKLGLHLGPFTLPWRMMAWRQPSADVPYPNTWMLPQFRTDRLLQQRLAQLGTPVEHGVELLELRQDPHTVTATVATRAGRQEITARYLVGADGGASQVRKQLGIPFVGSTDAQDRMLIADATLVGGALSRDRWHIWPARRGRFVGACPLPHGELFQWMFRLAPDEEPELTREALNRRVRAVMRNPRVELGDIAWTSVFRPNIRLADAYRSGRVFLAGDAAHVHTPAGGQGLNTGIQDGYNLGWKLAQVLAGAPADLLDSYEAERRPVAASVLGLSTKKYEGIGSLDPSSIKRGKDEQQLGITYFGGPLAPGTSDSTTTLRVGDRAPDAMLVDGTGTQGRLFDRLRGPHFTAIATGTGAADALERLPWPAKGASLRRLVVSERHARSTLHRSYGTPGDALILVRPDGYIGHIATRDLLDSTCAAITRLAPSCEAR